ncbi:MAG: hypothetical protein ACQESO_02730 [Bacillota bacterium]
MYKHFKDFKFNLTCQDVLRGQGIDPECASKRLVESAEAVIEEAHSLIKPSALYKVVRIKDFEHQKITFKGGAFEGPLVARAMAGADHLNIALCTIGSNLETRVEDMMKENPVMAVTLDGAGIAAIRKVAQAVEDVISTEACNLDLELGMRAQPGQEGWPIEQQREVFSVLPGQEIGIRLTESCLMIPRKSVSFVIPRGKDLSNSAAPCDFCSKRERCEWRKDKQAG